MIDLAIIIPAISKNRYSSKGDLESFGATTLLEWKISQCKELVNITQIYVSSNSKIIEDIACNEGVNFLKRENNNEYTNIILDAANKVKQKHILWANPSSPFIGRKEYISMINKYQNNNKYDSLISVNEKKDFVFYENMRLNFGQQVSSRETVKPILISTNGCYIIKKETLIKNSSLFGTKPYLYKLDNFSSIEIKDMISFELSKELISLYFKKDFNEK